MRKLWILAFVALFLSACGTREPKEENKAMDSLSSPGKNSTENVNPQQDNPVKDNQSVNNEIKGTGKPIHLSEDDFAAKVFDFNSGGKWKYKGDKPCMVDFYADWCGPCKMIAPYMEEFAENYKNKIYVYKVNTDFAKRLSGYFGINSIPAVMFCPMKGDYRMIIGANPKEKYISMIESFLLAK